MVQQFNETYKPENIKESPTFPTDLEFNLMGTLILEELKELAAAKDNVEFFDAIIDILYVTGQQAQLLGFPIDEGLREVHRSNMSKMDELGKPIIREDGKVLKGPNFKEPDLLKILGFVDGKPEEPVTIEGELDETKGS